MRRGTVSEQPWGLTLASLATSRGSGQLTLTADDGKLYCVAFTEGAVIGASSPLAADSAARVALTSHLVSSTQVPALARAVATALVRDEVDVVAEHARLTPEQAGQLRHRLLVQRVARTFSVDRGGYAFGGQVTVASMRGVEIDVGLAIFLGVRMNLSQDRLVEDLRRMGARFVLRTEDVDLARFGFTERERPILQALRIGTSLPDLEAKRRDLEPRTTQAVIYTLVATGLCEGLPAPRARAASIAPIAVAPTVPSVVPPPMSTGPFEAVPEPAHEPAAAPRARAELDPGIDPELDPELEQTKEKAREPVDEVELSRARTVTFDAARPRGKTVPPRTRTISSAPPPMPRVTNAFAAREVITAGIALLDRQADHFALLGVAQDAPIEDIRSAYVALACHLHPDKLPELDPIATRDAQRLFAHVNLAYGVLSDPARRADYLAVLRGEPAKGLRARTAPTTAPPPAGTAPERARAAAEVAQRGMHALRREDLPAAVELLTRATELAPQDVDYAAALAWARFCASTDKAAIAAEVRRALERAASRSTRPATARFYLGRVERMLGRVREALLHFHEVIQLDPGHAEAAAEIRLLEPRTARR
jgi:hypothetical protein